MVTNEIKRLQEENKLLTGLVAGLRIRSDTQMLEVQRLQQALSSKLQRVNEKTDL